MVLAAVAQELAEKLQGLLCHVNLIPLNPIPDSLYQPTSDADTERFAQILLAAGIPATVRRRLGLALFCLLIIVAVPSNGYLGAADTDFMVQPAIGALQQELGAVHKIGQPQRQAGERGVAADDGVRTGTDRGRIEEDVVVGG